MSEPFSESLDRLLFHLDNQVGFWFALVVADEAAPRGKLREAAEQWCKEHGATFFTQAPAPKGLVPLVIELSKGEQPGLHWIRADGAKGTVEQWDAGAAQLFMAMNERREAFRKRHVGGIVVEGRSSLKRLLRDLAPDLFSIRAFVAEPGEADETSKVEHFDAPEWSWPGSISFDVNANDPDVILQQIARLEANTEPQFIVRRMQLRGQVVIMLVNAKRVDEAKTVADALEMDARQLQDLPDALRRAADMLVLYAKRAHAFARGNMQIALECSNAIIDGIASMTAFEGQLHRSSLLMERASIRFALHDNDGGIADLRMAIACDEEDIHRSPQNPLVRGDLLKHSIKLARRLILMFDPVEAARVLRHALQRLDEWQAENPSEIRWLYERCKLEQSLGLALMQSLDPSGMLDAFRNAALTAEQCARRDPADHDIRRAKLDGYVLRGLGHALQRDLSIEAFQVYKQALGEVAFPWMQRAARSQVRRMVLDLFLSSVSRIIEVTQKRTGQRPPRPTD